VIQCTPRIYLTSFFQKRTQQPRKPALHKHIAHKRAHHSHSTPEPSSFIRADHSFALPESASNSFAQPEPASKSRNKCNPAHTTSDEDSYATPTLDHENDPGEPGDEEDQSPEPEPEPDIPLYTECPMTTFHEGRCKDIDVVPTHPTKALVRLLKDAQHSRSRDPWSSHTLRLEMACCIQISKEIIG
jgi:hypothetical protein